MEGFPGGASGKEPTCQCRRCKRLGFSPWVGKIPWRRKWHPTPIFLPGESHGWRSLVGCSPRSHKELDATDRLSRRTPILGAFLLMSMMASSLIDAFLVTQCPSLSFFMSFALESIWSHTKFVSPDFLSFLFYIQPLWTVIYSSLYCLLGER